MVPDTYETAQVFSCTCGRTGCPITCCVSVHGRYMQLDSPDSNTIRFLPIELLIPKPVKKPISWAERRKQLIRNDRVLL